MNGMKKHDIAIVHITPEVLIRILDGFLDVSAPLMLSTPQLRQQCIEVGEVFLKSNRDVTSPVLLMALLELASALLAQWVESAPTPPTAGAA
jgi:hypothetical protein